VYHRFGDSKHQSTNTSLKELRKEFNYFKDNGYKVVTVSDLAKLIKENKKIPDNYVALNIDDSYKSFYQNGLPLFKEFNYPFTLFVYVEASKRGYRDFMSFDEIRDVAKYGEIGLHSYSHPHLTTLTSKEVKKDTQKALDIFEKELGFRPKGYAYPYGEFDSSTQKDIKSFKFEYICNQNSGAISKFSSVYDLDRVALVGDTNVKPKFKIKALDVKWHNIKIDKNRIKKVILSTHSDIKKAQLYISGHGWQRVRLIDGKLDISIDKKMKFKRTRVILKTYDNRQSSKLLMRAN
jgi:peptidoglycan/xylan/chitin deacetylase (PgdA/CDA1 family)